MPAGDEAPEEAVEELASDVAIWLGDDLLRRAGLESAPQQLWDRNREEAAWLKGRDDMVAFIQDDLEGGIRRALEEPYALPAICKQERQRVREALAEVFEKRSEEWREAPAGLYEQGVADAYVGAKRALDSLENSNSMGSK